MWLAVAILTLAWPGNAQGGIYSPAAAQGPAVHESQAPASAFLAAILAGTDLGEQRAALVRQLDAVARDARRLFLDRVEAMDPADWPPAAEVERVAALPVGHAEAIVAETLLTPRQARKWRDRMA